MSCVLERRDRDDRESLTPGVKRRLDGRGIEPAMREHQHAVAGFERIALQENFGVPLTAFQPQQLARAARTHHVEPHQPRIVEREETNEAPVSREDIQYRYHRVAA